MFVIRGTTVSAEHVSRQAEPLNLKEFIYELDVPVIVGGCATYQAALHLMRTGAAGVLVGSAGARPTRRVRRWGSGADGEARWPTSRRPGGTTSTSPAGATCTSSPTAAWGAPATSRRPIACGADAVMVGCRCVGRRAPAGACTGVPRPTTRAAAGRARVVRARSAPLEEILFGPPACRRHDQPDRCLRRARWPPPATPTSRSSSGSRSSSPGTEVRDDTGDVPPDAQKRRVGRSIEARGRPDPPGPRVRGARYARRCRARRARRAGRRWRHRRGRCGARRGHPRA